MSSPYAPSDRSPSSQRSTPSRTHVTGVKRNGYHRGLRSSTNDSPSRQLIEDFGRMLINEERNLRSSLDEQTAAQHKLHVEALDRALAKHEQVRESAERTRVRIELELEQERRRREEEEKRAVDKARRDLEEQKLAQERRRLEEENARAEERRKQEALKREKDEAKRKVEIERQQKEADDKARKEEQVKDEVDRKAKHEAEARQKAQHAEAEKQKAFQQAAAPPPQTNGLSAVKTTPTPAGPPTPSTSAAQSNAEIPNGLVSSPDEREEAHRKYLDLHQRLKLMRQQVLDEAKRIGLKNKLSDSRRTIQKCCGQLSKLATPEAKETNKRATLEIVRELDAAVQMSQPSINITDYLVQNQQPPNANTQGPAALLFLLNHFAKTITRQFISESAVDPKSADAIGVLAVTIFARQQYLFNGQSLIDLLWAKFHKHAPALFGICGSEKTQAGRCRLGWAVNKDAGTFVSDQEHYDRLSGLASGFAAITLRDFSKSKNSNPAPNRIFWESMARIVNTATKDLQPSHFVLLKALINNSVPRIITTFGDMGVAAVRNALIFFPEEKGPQDEKGRKIPSVAALQAMPSVLQRELHLTL